MSDGRFERELVGKFEDAGYHALRLAASGGGTSADLPDVMAGNGKYFFAIELKSREPPEGSAARYGPVEDLGALTRFADSFALTPFVCVRWKGNSNRPVEWRLQWPGQLETTDTKFKFHYDERDDWMDLEDLPGFG